MPITKDNHVIVGTLTSDQAAIRAMELIENVITDDETADFHRINLSKFFIAWQRDERLNDEDQEAVYCTFLMLDNMLKGISQIQKGGTNE